MAGLGYGLILLGYYSGIGQRFSRSLPSLPRRFPARAVLPRAFVLIAIGLGAWLYQLIVVGRVHGRDDWFTGNPAENLVIQLAAFMGYGLALIAIVFFRGLRERRFGTLFALLVAVSCSAYVALAFVVRVELVVAALAITIAWNYRFKLLRTRTVVVSSLLILCVVFPVLGTARGLEQQGLTEKRTPGGGLSTATLAIHQLTKDGLGGYFTQTMDRLGERFHGVDSFWRPSLSTRQAFALTSMARLIRS